MVGAYHIEVESAGLKYELDISRQINVIRGNSGTGKTTLIEMIQAYQLYDEDSGVVVRCKANCVVIAGREWEKLLSMADGCIVFIDEGNRFLETEEFAKAIKHSNNYYVIVTRRALENLPYSVESIYELRASKRYAGVKQVYNEMHSLFAASKRTNSSVSVDRIIIEDNKSGFEFFSEAGKYYGFSCISAKGKSNIVKYIDKNSKEKRLIIADGAAFGCEMAKVMSKIKKYSNYSLYLPESFEWVILKSGVIKNSSLQDILDSPENYVETTKYFSWERYFTHLLTTITAGHSKMRYDKNALSQWYKSKAVIKKVVSVIGFFNGNEIA